MQDKKSIKNKKAPVPLKVTILVSNSFKIFVNANSMFKTETNTPLG